LYEYGLFLAKAVTLLLAILVIIATLAGIGQRGRRLDRGHIEVRSLNETLEGLTHTLKQAVLNPSALKRDAKVRKKQRKVEEKAQKKQAKTDSSERKPRVFVIDFEGDLQASAVKHLRQEVTAILAIAEPKLDEVVVRLESLGGQVHGYGLAASQLSRIADKQVSLTVAVDKVAASGGYMMACIADRIIAAPFALLGSIGVVAQLPNFHRFLKTHDVDFEVLTAGEYKRTLTVFGENTEQGREKFLQELEDVHVLFKDFVHQNRPAVEVDKVATGEAWYGRRALEIELCDELKTSDEYLVERCDDCDVFQVRYVEDKNRVEQLVDRFAGIVNKFGRAGTLESGRPHPMQLESKGIS